MGLDSVELICDVEKYFSISIPDEEAEKAYTVGILLNCIAGKLQLSRFDFTLRNKVFSLLTENLSMVIDDLGTPSIEDRIGNIFDEFESNKKARVEAALGMQLPGIRPFPPSRRLTGRLKHWLNFEKIYDLRNTRWKKYVDVLLASNVNLKEPPALFPSKYEVYIALVQLIVDKIGVDYFDIGLEKIFTDDLGID